MERTDYGGTANQGVVFSLVVPEPSSFLSLGIGALSMAAFGGFAKTPSPVERN